MMKPPFFSVIMTTYNRAALLHRALTSLFAQTEQDWEAILIDDGSTDNTRAHIDSFLKDSDKITYIYQENTGFITAKNRGIQRAKGAYITFLDSDDQYAPRHLERRKTFLLQNPEIDLLRGGVEIIGNAYVPDAKNPGKKIHLSECAISGSFFIKREAVLDLEGFQAKPLKTDADFLRRAVAANLQIRKIEAPKTYIYHRDTGSSITLDMLDAMEETNPPE